MKKDFRLFTKTLLREEGRKRRSAIGKKRREEAAQTLFEKFKSTREMFLSFSPLPEEIDLSKLNAFLAKQKRLILPKADSEKLLLFHIENPEQQLKRSKWNLLEPIPEKCKKALFAEIQIILIPGLIFDQKFHRIGYGGGFYDRLLSNLVNARKIGVGFKEQLLEDLIPIKPHDQALDELLLL